VSRFSSFVAIDWSGAVGARQAGIAVALCRTGDDAPVLVRAGHVWSRAEVLDWLVRDLPHNSLVGLDLGIGLPFVDRGAFFPGWAESPSDARSLWALIDARSTDEPNLAASRFIDDPAIAPHFRRHGGRTGAAFEQGRGRLRATEEAQRAQGLNPYSNFNLVGAAQVGKSSLTGMRMLARLPLAVWPVDPMPTDGSVVVEIYTSLAAVAAGLRKGRTKIRDAATLDAALDRLGSAPHTPLSRYTDHATDAILTAAWLRRAAHDAALWSPPALTDLIARTEGWTFGVR
jgi:hypothetical protein